MLNSFGLSHQNSGLQEKNGWHRSLLRAEDVLTPTQESLIVSKQKLRQAEVIRYVRFKRESGAQAVGFASRPFVLCGLPVKKPAEGTLLHERRNGRFILQVVGHPSYGLPWGQDRLVPIFLATLAVRQQNQTINFSNASEMLDLFGLSRGGSQYRRLISAFQRVFGATIFFGTDTQINMATVVHQSRFNFLSEARLWYASQRTMLDDFENTVILSDEFYREIMNHPIPTDLEAVRVLSSSPAALDLFTWLSYRCFTANGEERIPLFGDSGLVGQLGSVEYARPRKFREQVEQWLDLIRSMWPSCPARISSDGCGLIVHHATAIAQQRCS